MKGSGSFSCETPRRPPARWHLSPARNTWASPLVSQRNSEPSSKSGGRKKFMRGLQMMLATELIHFQRAFQCTIFQRRKLSLSWVSPSSSPTNLPSFIGSTDRLSLTDWRFCHRMTLFFHFLSLLFKTFTLAWPLKTGSTVVFISNQVCRSFSRNASNSEIQN